MKQRLYNAAVSRSAQVRGSVASRSVKVKSAAYALIGAGVALLPMAANAQTSGAGGSQTYGLGQAGSPASSDYFNAAQGFNSSLAPLLTAILPVLVVILAIWQGPKLLKRLTTMMAH